GIDRCSSAVSFTSPTFTTSFWVVKLPPRRRRNRPRHRSAIPAIDIGLILPPSERRIQKTQKAHGIVELIRGAPSTDKPVALAHQGGCPEATYVFLLDPKYASPAHTQGQIRTK